jgi:hypothetical protein
LLRARAPAAPQWAALFALANQRREEGNLSGNDLAESPLYHLASPDYVGRHDHRDFFTDIQTGTNGVCGSVGYDFVTGLGSPRAKELVDALDDY